MGQPDGGDTLSPPAEHIGWREASGGTETSHVPRRKERIPGVAASETGGAQTVGVVQAAADALAGLNGSPDGVADPSQSKKP